MLKTFQIESTLVPELLKSARGCGATCNWKSECKKHCAFGAILEDQTFKKCSCGAKHISKSKCQEHQMCGPLLEVEMSENMARRIFSSQKCESKIRFCVAGAMGSAPSSK